MSCWRVELTQKYWLTRFSCQWWLLTDQITLHLETGQPDWSVSSSGESVPHWTKPVTLYIYMNSCETPPAAHSSTCWWKYGTGLLKTEKQKGRHCHSVSCWDTQILLSTKAMSPSTTALREFNKRWISSFQRLLGDKKKPQRNWSQNIQCDDKRPSQRTQKQFS